MRVRLAGRWMTMTTLQEARGAYQPGRREAHGASTMRLRLVERRLSRHEDWLTKTERAFLAAVRKELGDRGFEVRA